MYKELREDVIEKLNKLTITDYEMKGNMIPAENIDALIDDLLCEIERQNEEIEDLKEYKEQYCNKYTFD